MEGPPYLSGLMNNLLSKGEFSEIFKKSEIILLPKPGKDSNTISAYRPVF